MLNEEVGLNLYRRHRTTCKSWQPHNDRSGEFEERKKGWGRCDCPIVASGALNGEFKRKSTKVWEWEAAKSVASQWESNDSWSGLPAPVQVSPPISVVSHSPEPESGVKISEAIAKYKEDIADDLADSTARMYRYLLRYFANFSVQKSYI